VVCQLHAVLCELIPGGVSKAITAPAATRLLDSIEPATAVDAARRELAAGFLDDLQRIDAQLRQTRKKLTTAVQASGTSLTGLFGVGPVAPEGHLTHREEDRPNPLTQRGIRSAARAKDRWTWRSDRTRVLGGVLAPPARAPMTPAGRFVAMWAVAAAPTGRERPSRSFAAA
jgi:hypothetical protein